MGVAPRLPGRLDAIPPRENGGNLDTRHLGAGTKIVFPVFVPGALFSCGDCHSAQGDGEINGTGIESNMTVTLRFGLMKDAGLQEVRFITPPRKKLTTADTGGYYVTTAQGPDLFKNAQQAVRYMLDYMTSEYDLSRAQAYCLCGAAVDLKINQIVDAPNFMVSAFLPLSIFAKPRAQIRSKARGGQAQAQAREESQPRASGPDASLIRHAARKAQSPGSAPFSLSAISIPWLGVQRAPPGLPARRALALT